MNHTSKPLWKMTCDKCTFIKHDSETLTDWYVNLTDKPACLLVKYGDRDWEYDFHVFTAGIPYSQQVIPGTEPGLTYEHIEALLKAWEYLKEM